MNCSLCFIENVFFSNSLSEFVNLRLIESDAGQYYTDWSNAGNWPLLVKKLPTISRGKNVGIDKIGRKTYEEFQKHTFY